MIETQETGEDYNFYSLKLGGTTEGYINSYIDNRITLRFIQDGRALDSSVITVSNPRIRTVTNYLSDDDSNLLDSMTNSEIDEAGNIFISAEELNPGG